VQGSGDHRAPQRLGGARLRGVDPVTGKAHRVSRQMEGRHRGARAKALAELVDLNLEWREHNDEPIGPRTIQGYRALAEARVKPGVGNSSFPRSIHRRCIASTWPCARARASRRPGEPLSGSRLRDLHAVNLRRARPCGPVRLDTLQPGDVDQAACAAECQAADADQASQRPPSVPS